MTAATSGLDTGVIPIPLTWPAGLPCELRGGWGASWCAEDPAEDRVL